MGIAAPFSEENRGGREVKGEERKQENFSQALGGVLRVCARFWEQIKRVWEQFFSIFSSPLWLLLRVRNHGETMKNFQVLRGEHSGEFRVPKSTENPSFWCLEGGPRVWLFKAVKNCNFLMV